MVVVGGCSTRRPKRGEKFVPCRSKTRTHLGAKEGIVSEELKLTDGTCENHDLAHYIASNVLTLVLDLNLDVAGGEREDVVEGFHRLRLARGKAELLDHGFGEFDRRQRVVRHCEVAIVF